MVCHGNQTKSQITTILAIFKSPYQSNIFTKLGTNHMALEELSFESVYRQTDRHMDRRRWTKSDHYIYSSS